MPPTIRVRPAASHDIDASEPLLEHLDQPEAALTNLARVAGLDEDQLLVGSGAAWLAHVDVDGTSILACSDGAHWSLHAPAGVDEADAMLAARKLHGLLGERDEAWDLDR
jgi:hypothetical protein